MRILLTGGTGFIGTALCEQLHKGGHQLVILTRCPPAKTAVDRYVSHLEAIDAGERFDAVINLAGASLADRRWTRRYKEEIVASRLDTTRGLLELLYRLEVKPRSLLSGSAVGYYGHHGDEVLDESGACSPGFSQDLCQQWEQMASRAMEQGVRVCLLRLGVVLDRGAGAFPRMALPFRLGLGHWMGGGRQWLSWVHRRDVVRAILFLLQRPELDGAFNVILFVVLLLAIIVKPDLSRNDFSKV